MNYLAYIMVSIPREPRIDTYFNIYFVLDYILKFAVSIH